MDLNSQIAEITINPNEQAEIKNYTIELIATHSGVEKKINLEVELFDWSTSGFEDANAKLLYQKLITTSYEPYGNAYQYGTSVRLDICDCRMQDWYYLNGIIHFVFSADDQGYSGIRYHRLDPTLLNINNFQIFSASDERDFCYPSIAPFSNVTGDHTSVIHFASSGIDYYPDMRAKLYFNDFTSVNFTLTPSCRTSNATL